MRIGSTLYGLMVVVCAPGALAGPLKATPSTVTLHQDRSISLLVTGLPGHGAAGAAANVGRVTRVTPEHGGLRVELAAPEATFPQQLCLAVWRARPGARVRLLRVALLGRTDLPVTSRPRAEVRVRIGERHFGPVITDLKGRARVQILVPPGTGEATVEVTDRVGMVTEKQVKIQQPPHNLLTVAILPRKRALRVVLATCEPRPHEVPRLAIDGEDVTLKRLGDRMWHGRWTATAALEQGARVKVSASLPGDGSSVVEQEVVLPTQEPATVGPDVARTAPPAHVVTQTDKVPAPRPRRLRLQLAAVAGMLHNLGQLLAPHFAGEVGLLYRLPRGQIGLLASVGCSWAGQTIASTSAQGDAESSVTLVPLGLGVTYQLPVGRFSPFVTAGYLLQIVSTSTRASFFEERRRVEAASGFQGTAGAAYRLGPGSVLLQAGYLWSRVDNVDIRLLAGGLVVDVGYRVQL